MTVEDHAVTAETAVATREEVGRTLPLSVVVVTRNEADRIETCLESVFDACRAVEAFEVVLVDSNSTDGTVELASEYPITVLRIPNDELTTPGAGRHVGTAHAAGDAILFVDGDMALADGWLSAAMATLAEDGVAAVDGYLNEAPADAAVSPVDYVRGVALYDAAVLRSVGGFDPQLAAVEDVHLGFLLSEAGYRLLRLPKVAARHPSRGGVEPLRRWRRGYSRGNGQAMRKSAGSPRLVAKYVYRVRHRLVVGGWGVLGMAALATGAGVAIWFALSVVGFAVVVRKRGGGVGDAALYLLNKFGLVFGLAMGLLDEPKPEGWFPLERVEVVVEGPVHEGDADT